jgi:hypothetical protein
MSRERFRRTPASKKPERQPVEAEPEVQAFLKRVGLEDAEVLAFIPNDAWDKLGPEERRLAHGLFEAAFQLIRKLTDERLLDEGTDDPE